MKYLLFFFASVGIAFVGATSPLDAARDLAQQGIIINQSSSFAGNSSSQESSLYRLNDFLSRQEALGIALKLLGANLDNRYTCRGYFADTSEWWVCRASEIAADYGLVTRANRHFRPRDTLTLAESLGILFRTLDIPLSQTSTRTLAGNVPDWQKRIILTINEQSTNTRFFRAKFVRSLIFPPALGGYELDLSNFVFDEYSDGYYSIGLQQKLTRGQFFQIVLLLTHGSNSLCSSYRYSTCPASCQPVCRPSSCTPDGICTADCGGAGSCQEKTDDVLLHCTSYNDGCNDCVRINGVAACTKRACFVQGTPSCSVCEEGYTLLSGRCVQKETTCVAEGGYAGGGYVPHQEDINSFQCCSSLVRADRKDGNMIADGGAICIRQGDGFCDARYESAYNSSDCRPAFDLTVCASYYDGCNTCSRTSSGQSVCTLRACMTPGIPYCTSYIPYTPRNQNQDRAFLDKIDTEIQAYLADVSCLDTSDCKYASMGDRPCNISSAMIPYSTRNVDSVLLNQKTLFYTDAEKLYNTTYNIVGPCIYLSPPRDLRCINRTCSANY